MIPAQPEFAQPLTEDQLRGVLEQHEAARHLRAARQTAELYCPRAVFVETVYEEEWDSHEGFFAVASRPAFLDEHESLIELTDEEAVALARRLPDLARTMSAEELTDPIACHDALAQHALDHIDELALPRNERLDLRAAPPAPQAVVFAQAGAA